MKMGGGGQHPSPRRWPRRGTEWSPEGDNSALRGHRAHFSLDASLYAHQRRDLPRAQNRSTATQFIIVIIFSGGILICPRMC